MTDAPPNSRPDSGDEPLRTSSIVAGLREAAAHCTACGLYRNATQTLFGEGPEGALIMLIGEQPGDLENLAGHPFVGPAEKLLGRCLAEAGIDRARTYITNVVKHFKWVARGPRRIHSKPGAVEIEACFPGSRPRLRRWRRESSSRWGPSRRRPCSEKHSASPEIADGWCRRDWQPMRSRPCTPRRFRAAPTRKHAIAKLADRRGFAQGSGDCDMTRGVRKGSAFTWIVATAATAAVLAVAVVVAEFWSSIGDSGISVAGWFAMGLGIVFTLALGIGLMSLVFFSNRRGYDETARRDH